MCVKTINRDAGDKLKGFRLQKLRAVEKLIDNFDCDSQHHYFCTIEYKEDVYEKIINDGQITKSFEQDKDYKQGHKFTFNSSEIKKTLVSFLDIWFDNAKSSNVKFAFYTNAGYTIEGNSILFKEHDIKPPSKSILENLRDHNFPDEFLKDLSTLVISIYEEEYSKHKTEGNLIEIQKLELEEWREFFELIEWKFGMENEEELEEKILQKIRKLDIYDSRFIGKEQIILAAIEQLVEKSQNKIDKIEKFIHISQVKEIFYKHGNAFVKKKDNAYQNWNYIEPTDRRNLKEKFLDACKDFCNKELNRLSRKAISGRIEYNTVDEKEASTFKFRVYEACEDKLNELLKSFDKNEFTQSDIENLLCSLLKAAKQHLINKSVDYDYCFKNDDIIYKTILILFDECYLSLEG